MFNGVAEQAGLLAKIIAPLRLPGKTQWLYNKDAPKYSGGTAPGSNRTSLLSIKNTPVPNYELFILPLIK